MKFSKTSNVERFDAVESDKKICANEIEIYEKVKHLGNGSFSTVSLYRKQNKTTGETKLVALKRMNIRSLDQSQLDLAINEVKILSISSHENIINYYGSFIWNSCFYIEMEYADAGTLADFLASLESPLEEIEILALFMQIVSAVVYLHDQNIIHRDLKTANIFLNKQGFIKIGDFGISKLLGSQIDARSFVGTPFYISPEIFEGKAYNKPCDIWSLGCILYEMASLHKTFDAKNLSTLMQKIIKGTYLPINNKFSKSFHKLVHSLLQKNPTKRPEARPLLDRLISMLNKLSLQDTTIWSCSTIKDFYVGDSFREYIRLKSDTNLIRCSYLFCLNGCSPSMRLDQIKFPHQLQLKQFCKGKEHFLALTTDHKVYSWGFGPNGELGQGVEILSVQTPMRIQSLQTYSIVKIACGDGFSVFVAKNGLVFTCGSYRSSCLGNSECQDCFEPKLVRALLNTNIIDISCSYDHVVVVSSEGIAYSWGYNQHGKLGLNLESNSIVAEPNCVSLPNNVKLKEVICGINATAWIDVSGCLWLCGSNRYNKLTLNSRGLFSCNLVTNSMVPRKVSFQPNKVLRVCLGLKHSIFILDNFKTIAAGCNEDAQLGMGHIKQLFKPAAVKLLKNDKIKTAKAGTCFTVALSDNSLYFWGTRKILIDNSNNTEKSVSTSFEQNEDFVIGKCNESLMSIVENYGPDYPIVKITEPKVVIRKLKDLFLLNSLNSLILTKQSILNLYSTKTLQNGELFFNDIYCTNSDQLYVIVDSFVTERTNSIEGIMPNNEKLSFDVKSNTNTEYSYAWIDN